MNRACVITLAWLLILGACTHDEGGCPASADCANRRDLVREGGSVVFGVLGSPATLDPYSREASELTYELAAPVYPSLFRFDPQGRPHPYLAAAIRKVRGGVRVRLRTAVWSDGSAVSSRDVVRSLARARSPSGFSRIASARVVSPRVVYLQGRLGDWKRALATLAYVLPQGSAKRVSAGPFKVTSYTPGLQLVLRRNERWWGRAHLQRVTVQFLPSLQVLLMLAARGDLDAAVPPSTVNLDARLDSAGLRHSDALGWESIRLSFSLQDLTLAERRSLSAAVNRRALERGFVRSAGRVANTLDPGPGSQGADGPWRHIAARTTHVEGRVILSAPEGDESIELVQRILQKQMSTVASDVELATAEPETFYGPWSVTDPTQIALSRTSGAPGLNGDTRAYRQAAALPLFQVETVLAWRNGLTGLQVNPTFDGALWNVEQWHRSR